MDTCLPAGRVQEFPKLQIQKVMWTIYAIQSEVDKRIYVGMTKDLDRQIKEHNAGKNRSTKAYKPWIVIFTEDAGENTIFAREKEKYYKSGIGKEKLKLLAS